MSDILIKGMEMPKRCGLCPCFHAEHPMHCQAVKASKDKRIIAPYGAPIPDWCPLIELPPHGRLIDGDKFYKVMCSHWVLSLGEAYKRLEEFLEKPVIEAEGSETR